MNTPSYLKERFDQLQSGEKDSSISSIRQKAFDSFSTLGIPTPRHEEWKYTRIGSLFNQEYDLPISEASLSISSRELESFRLPKHEKADELVFVNGIFSFPLSKIRSSDQLSVILLDEALQDGHRDFIATYFGHSSDYIKDGINALNTAFLSGAVLIDIKKVKEPGLPIYIYNVTDSRSSNILSQPRSLIRINKEAHVQLVEKYITIGSEESFTNEVTEIVVEEGAMLEFYKIQNDSGKTSLVSTSHIRQVGKSYVHTVTISLNGGIVRNNLNVLLEAEHCEAHLYGLYFQNGQSHVDNHTIVDNVKPHCFSNELYKGILDDQATGVFNGKIVVRPQAQKTNAYQSNRNVLLSDAASVNSKPQLEIFADDVKCTHGCTVGQLNEEGLFYLQSRGISEKTAKALLLQAFATDILEHIKPEHIRVHVEELISRRLEFDAV